MSIQIYDLMHIFVAPIPPSDQFKPIAKHPYYATKWIDYNGRYYFNYCYPSIWCPYASDSTGIANRVIADIKRIIGAE